MMVTLLGAAVSDQLETGEVVSGVGGQYNFVAMAQALPDARSILCVRATRTRGGRTTSNLLWSYGLATIPRHLRDIVVTEYGIADIRGRTDEETIAALLNVADSRFQEELLSRARAAGKIRADYRIPEAFRNNFPGRLELALESHRRQGYFSEYPFGTDLTGDEIALARALKYLERRTGSALARLGTAAAALGARPAERHASALERGLDVGSLQLPAQDEAAPIDGRAHVGVHRLGVLGQLELHIAFEQQRVAVHADVEPLPGHSGHVRLERDPLAVLVDVDGRPHPRLGASARLLDRSALRFGGGNLTDVSGHDFSPPDQ